MTEPRAPLPYPPRVELAAVPTPIRALRRFSSHLGGPELLVKREDRTGLLLSGNKVRKLEFLLADARARGADTLLTRGAVGSNHCRATAVVAAREGLGCHLILCGPDEGPPRGNLLIDRLVGASFTRVTDPADFSRLDAIEQQVRAELRRQGREVYVVPDGGSNDLGALGYVRMVEELVMQGASPSHLVHAVGSGGTTAGLVLGRWLTGIDLELIGVTIGESPSTLRPRVDEIVSGAARRLGVHVDARSQPLTLLERLSDRTFREQRDLMRDLAELEGVLLDPVYTGPSFLVLVREIRAGRFDPGDRVLFLHTGGLFELLARGEELLDP